MDYVNERLRDANSAQSIPNSTPWLDPLTGKRLRHSVWSAHGTNLPSIRDGAKFSFHSIPPRSQRPNHPSAVRNSKAIAQQLAEMEAAGLIEYCPAITPELAFVNNINPFAAVPKSDGTVRIIIDPTSTAVNSHMAPLDLRLPSVEFALGLTKPHSILGKRDLKSGFHHVVLAPESRRFMGFRHPSTGQIGRWVVLPFGAAQSPAIFCQITAESARIFNDALRMHNNRATVVVYVDDYLIIADSHADLQAAIFIMDSLGAALGLIWNLDKDVLGATSLEFLGLNIDAARQQISLPDNKRQKYLAGVLDFISTYQHSASCPRKAVEKLTGQLAFAARSMRWGALSSMGSMMH